MDSASLSFVLFGLVVALLSNLSKSAIWRTSILLGASILFLMMLSPHPVELLPFAGFLVLGYLGVRFVGSGRTRALPVVVTLVGLVFAWLKKYSFLPRPTFIGMPYLTLGLSYVFFRVLHLIIEAGQGDKEAGRIPLFGYLAYTVNFTTLVSGPIQFYEDFAADQFSANPPALTLFEVASQMERIILGFFKVNVLAVLLNMVKLDAQARLTEQLPAATKIGPAGLLIVFYAFYLYANFSGYIDIVIALARLMRVRLPENFNRPFSATSFIDFWSRWHITLSNWLKTYIYNPLLMALMRRTTSPSLEPFLGVFAFFVTFFSIGIWHGRTSEFAFFGILQGGGVAVNKLWQIVLTKKVGRKRYRELAAKRWYETLGRGLTFVWFAVTLFWFWGRWPVLGAIFASISLFQWVAVLLGTWLLMSVVLETWERLRSLLLGIQVWDEPVLLSRYARTVYSTAMFATSFVMVVFFSGAAPAVVYKAF